MSYILDALKKSDQERQQGNTPTLHSVHGPILPVRNSVSFRQRYLLWLVGGVFLLLISGLALLFSQSRQHSTAGDPETNGEQPQRFDEAHAPATTTPALPAEQPAAADNTSAPLTVVKEKRIAPLSIVAQKRGASRPRPEKTMAAPTALPFLDELSPALLAEIPDLKFAGHTYSSGPSQRMIIVNGKILREGDMIAPGLHLAEITWEGVIIEFKGTLFRVQIN